MNIRTYILLIIAILSGSNSNAQGPAKLKTAVSGNFYAGPSMLRDDELNKYLQREDIFGNGFKRPQSGLYLGGELSTVYRSFITGFGAYTIRQSQISNAVGSAQSSVYGAYLKFGYAVYQKKSQAIYPYVALGLASYYTRLANLRDSGVIYFNRSEGIQAGDDERYNFSNIVLEAGLAYRFIPLPQGESKKTGLIIGIEAGLQFYDALEGFHSLSAQDHLWLIKSMLGTYLRISLGGGSL